MTLRESINPLSRIQSALHEIGYGRNLLRTGYEFADVLSEGEPTHYADLVAFSAEPTSYRNACVAVVLGSGEQASPTVVSKLRSVGAPLVFSVGDEVTLRWKMTAHGNPIQLDAFPTELVAEQIVQNREAWSPVAISRVKNRTFDINPVQLDFYDSALIPEIDVIVRSKLSALIEKVSSKASLIESENTAEPLNERALFQLVFRLLSAKLIADKEQIDTILQSDVDSVLAHVHANYFSEEPKPYLLTQVARQGAWDVIRNGFNLKNASVQSLAYVYENSFVSPSMRRRHGIHGTPIELAELIVNTLPFELLPESDRTVFEPFTGQGVFLIAALSRLKDLLGDNVSAATSHSYLRRHLAGVELDPFSVEVSKLSLTLADYPNSNGWNIENADVFGSSQSIKGMDRSQIVLCNPPFETFNHEEQKQYQHIQLANKAVAAMHQILDSDPVMLGVVLPSTFVDGVSYRSTRVRLIQQFGDIQTFELPDNVFEKSEAETIVVLARKDNTRNKARVRVGKVDRSDYPVFLETGQVTDVIEVDSEVYLDVESSWPRSSQTNMPHPVSQSRSLGDVVEIHRGTEYFPGRTKESVSQNPAPGFRRGIARSNKEFLPLISTPKIYLSTLPHHIKSKLPMDRWEDPKVIVNAARKGRKGWLMVAVPDDSGMVANQNFQCLWPFDPDTSIEVIAAVLNGVVANYWMSQRVMRRHIRKLDLEELPWPDIKPTIQDTITQLVRAFRKEFAIAQSKYGTADTANRAVSVFDELQRRVEDSYGLSRSTIEHMYTNLGPMPWHPKNTLLLCGKTLWTRRSINDEIQHLGLALYGTEGFQEFLDTVLDTFDKHSARQLIQSSDSPRVLEFLLREHEGSSH